MKNTLLWSVAAACLVVGGPRFVAASDVTKHVPPAAAELSEAEVDRLCPPRPETAAEFKEGTYPPAAHPYREAALKAFAYMTSLPAMRTLVEKGEPEQTYQHNAYVSKTHAAHVMLMLEWAKHEPARRKEAMRFAKASAEYLLKQLEPKNAPLAWWPPTYGRKPLRRDPADGGENRPAMVGNEPEGAVKYRGEVMLLYPADVGTAFVAYYRETHDRRFLEAAKGIGKTYLKMRRPDGSWPLKMRLATGEAIGENTLVPTCPLALFSALAGATKEKCWAKASDDCFAWLEAHPLTDWNWDGQFEDIQPCPPYANPTKHNAVDAMFEILRRFPKDKARIEQCRRILRFCEKRFVCWEKPANHPQWDAPSVLEQYSCFVPIDASAAKMIRAYLALWRVTGEPELLAKARTLGDTTTRVQTPEGRIPTFWTHDTLTSPLYDWLNCMGSSAVALLELSDAGTKLARDFSAEDGLRKARENALAPRTDRARASSVVWTQGGVSSPEGVFVQDGRCATLKRTADTRVAPAFAIDFGKASVEGWAVIRVRSAKGSPVLRLAYANYPDRDALREDGDFNEESRAIYMGRDVELPVLPANVNRHELYRIPGAGTFVAPMLMPQFRYMRVQLDTPGEVEIDAIEVAMRDVCDTSLLDGYFASSDPDVNRLWQIGAWTAQLATIKTTWAWNSVEGLLQPRKLTKGPDVHLSAAKDVMPAEGKMSVKLTCGVNPTMLAHAGVALLAADSDNALLCELSGGGTMRWVRRARGEDNVLSETHFDAPIADGRMHGLEIDWRTRANSVRLSVLLDGKSLGTFDYYHRPHGRRIGFWSRKGWWPSYDDLAVSDGGGKVVFMDDFDDSALCQWEFERPDPFVSDGAKRDRLVWSGDLYWAGRNFYYAFGDSSLMRKTIGLLARNQTPEGYVHACPYAEQPAPKAGDWGAFESDEFAAWFIPVLHDYWRHTGDDSAVREFLPNVRRLLDYLGRFTREDGLFEQRLETSKHAFSPWLQKGDTRHRSYMDILLWMCWRGAAEMARAVGEDVDAAAWEEQAAKVRAVANRAYWDEARGRFRGAVENYRLGWRGEVDSIGGQVFVAGETSPDEVAMEPNALAVESGFVTPAQARRICPQLTDQSPVRKFILLSAIGKARSGFGEDAWRIIAGNRWGVFADPAWDGPWATAEGMDPPRYGSCDQSHPDVAPAGFISSCFLGIVPLAPGFARFSFSPKPPDGMTFAEGRVPTKYGPIDARWERAGDGFFAFELVVPEGTVADVVPPAGRIVEVDGVPGDGRGLPPGRHRLQTLCR